MTVETAIWHVLDAGGSLHVEGDRLILNVPDATVARRIPREALDTLRAHRGEAVRIVARMEARERARGGPLRFAFQCVVCGSRFDEDDLAPDAWVPIPGEPLGWWPRCPECAARRRTPAPESPARRRA